MKTSRTPLILFLLASVLCTLGVTSCRTIGRGIERTGEHIENSTR
jgi:predicted small secreted protein